MARIAARQRDAELIAGLPADEVEAFLRRRQEQAAVDIQRMVRGHCARVAAARRRLDNKQHAAASTIQRSVRRHQARRRSEQTAAQTSAAGGYFLPPRPPLADSKHREVSLAHAVVWHEADDVVQPLTSGFVVSFFFLAAAAYPASPRAAGQARLVTCQGPSDIQ